jgi:hypothetical protein
MSDKKKMDSLKNAEVDAKNIKGGRAIRQHNTLNVPAEPTRAGGKSVGTTLNANIGLEAEELMENRIRPTETK